jgi:adenine-specific DNA-methyltransferase
MARKKKTTKKSVATLTHDDASRTNIPTAEFESVMRQGDRKPVAVEYERPGGEAADAMQDETADRNPDLDPQLVWRGKDTQAWPDLVVQAPPLFIQEKVHPKALVDDLRRQTEAADVARKLADKAAAGSLGTAEDQFDLFADFNGLPDDPAVRTEFYQHDAHWTNRLILGDSLSVMASLAEREGLRGKVQCIYLDPPYGIKFNSNFQWSTTSRDVKDGKADHITREPEQVKAFRDTWRDGIHSYLTYLRDRLTVARDLLHDTGSIFVQIGDENVHRVRAVMDEVFGEGNFVSLVAFRTTTGLGEKYLDASCNYILWFAKQKDVLKYRDLYKAKTLAEDVGARYRRLEIDFFDRRPMTSDERASENAIPDGVRVYRHDNLTSQSGTEKSAFPIKHNGLIFKPGRNYWKSNEEGIGRLQVANRLANPTKKSISYVRFLDDYPVSTFSNVWTDTQTGAFTDDKTYVVQTNTKVIERCLLMATDPGDLVLDPTCGSGTTAYVAEQWGRRWITIDTSRVSLALARARIMGARYPFYLLADSKAGVEKEAELTRSQLPDGYKSKHYSGNVRQGFVYERVPHITLKSIANNAEIDVIHEKYQQQMEPIREALNQALGTTWEQWEIPRDLEEARAKAQSRKDEKGLDANLRALAALREISDKAVDSHAQWWTLRIARQKEIDASIAAKADSEYLYDKPYEDKKKVRVAGPFTVESLSPHRVLGVDENDELIDPLKKKGPSGQGAGGPSVGDAGQADAFLKMVIENLKTAGVQQAHKEDKITFTSIAPWPGEMIAAEGRYVEGPPEAPEGGAADGKAADPPQAERRAGIFIGPEFGTVSRQDLVVAAREAADAGFDVLIACAFNYEAHASEFRKLGALPILKARMNADLHMADDLKNNGNGNLFVIFGEPDIDLLPPEDATNDAAEENDLRGYDTMRVRINGVDVFHPATGEVRSDDADGIACWFIDTDYNEESFFVRQAYFLGANDPYKALKTTLKAEIDPDAWESLHSDTSREFPKPKGGRIAVKVINHLGDEVMKVFRVE